MNILNLEKEETNTKFAYLFSTNILLASSIMSLLFFVLGISRTSPLLIILSLTITGIGIGLSFILYKKNTGQLKSIKFKLEKGKPKEKEEPKAEEKPKEEIKDKGLFGNTEKKEKKVEVEDPLETDEVEMPVD